MVEATRSRARYREIYKVHLLELVPALLSVGKFPPGFPSLSVPAYM
jgi:hypothetical protein